MLHQFSCALFCGAVIFAAGCGRAPSSFTRQVAEKCPPDWSVSASNNVITLRRETAVWVMGKVSNPPRSPDESLGDYFKSAGQEIHYEVRLRFVPLMSEPAYQQLKAAREEAASRFSKGASGKSEYTQWQIHYEECQVPALFTKDYSIFMDRWAARGSMFGYRMEPRFVDVYPPDAASEIESVIRSLSKMFNEYPASGI
jgi:hypothetical protein